MKKILFIIFALFAFAVQADNVITSKEYVDTQVGNLQEQIGANDANTVLTYTDTAGTVGEKKIYDSSAAYSGQNDALVTAGAFNTAIQNALDTEFVCVERQAETGGCLLYQIRATTPKPSGKNLFDINNAKIIFRNSTSFLETKTETGYTLTKGTFFSLILLEIGNINDFIGKRLTVSANASCTNGVKPRYLIGISNDDGTQRTSKERSMLVEPEEGKTKVVMWLYASTGENTDPTTVCTYSNIQIEEGTVATEYEPYQNLYLPSSN